MTRETCLESQIALSTYLSIVRFYYISLRQATIQLMKTLNGVDKSAMKIRFPSADQKKLRGCGEK